MKNRALHDALTAFVEEAAWQLAAEVSGGAEIPFELIEQGRSTAPLYCYRPQTGLFLADRAGELRKLPSHAAARSQVSALAGVDDYLRRRGVRAVPPDALDRADMALQSFVTHVWADATDFVYEPDRFEAAFAALEDAVYADTSLTEVLAPVDGLVIESERIELGNGMAFARAVTIHDAPEELRLDPWSTVAIVRIALEAAPLEDAGRRLRRLQTALRLWDDAEPSIGPVAWARHGAGAWALVALPTGPRRSTGDVLLAPEEEDALRAFCSLIGRRMPKGGELAWALRRFELGCERPSALEALTDWLLAGRALLVDPEQPGYDRLAERLAAICAQVSERDALTERLQRAVALERTAIAGRLRAEDEVEALIGTLAGCIRAVLRDTLCGHLDPDLRAVADELLEQGVTPAA
jgi:hypothetical protein